MPNHGSNLRKGQSKIFSIGEQKLLVEVYEEYKHIISQKGNNVTINKNGGRLAKESQICWIKLNILIEYWPWICLQGLAPGRLGFNPHAMNLGRITWEIKELFMPIIFHFFEYSELTDHSIYLNRSGLGRLLRNSPEWNLCGDISHAAVSLSQVISGFYGNCKTYSLYKKLSLLSLT